MWYMYFIYIYHEACRNQREICDLNHILCFYGQDWKEKKNQIKKKEPCSLKKDVMGTTVKPQKCRIKKDIDHPVPQPQDI